MRQHLLNSGTLGSGIIMPVLMFIGSVFKYFSVFLKKFKNYLTLFKNPLGHEMVLKRK